MCLRCCGSNSIINRVVCCTVKYFIYIVRDVTMVTGYFEYNVDKCGRSKFLVVIFVYTCSNFFFNICFLIL